MAREAESSTGGHTYVDESKRRDYLLVAATIEPTDLDRLRKLLRGLVLPGERHIHMKDEGDRRKRTIAAAIAASGVTATVYDAGRRYPTELERRAACLRALVTDAATRGDGMLVLEADDTLVTSDRRLLYREVRRVGCAETLHYDHRKASGEMLLGVADAVAWCWAKGGDWRRRIHPVITAVRRV
jgi:hypothetical protein